MRKRLIVLMLGAATGAFAHHGYDSHYDGTRLISLKGRVVSFSIENPHTRIVIEVADARGQKETWAIETVLGVSPVWWRPHIAKSVRSNG